MKDIILKVENISKQYRLGQVGTGTLSHDLNRWWHQIRGKENPYLKIGDTNDRSTKGESDYVWALQHINFEVAQGEVLGIIGKNGAGKSTLLKILSKVTSPTTGSIKSRGRIASLLEVGTGFNPELTGKENIFLNGAILGMTKKGIVSRLEEIVDFSGCERYIDTPVKRYSSGMTVRLAFAVAAFLEPEILVVDEVLAVGDVEFQKKAIGKMQDISRQGGRTVLFVSHNMAAVQSLCTRGIVLENGLSCFDGSAQDAVKFYLNQNSNNSKVSLLEQKNRKGSGEFRFSKIEMLNKEGCPVHEIFTGAAIKFRLHFKVFKELGLSDLAFGIVIIDQNEVKIADFYSDEMGVLFEDIYKNNYVDLEIPKLQLRGGVYNLVIVVQNGTFSAQQIDLLHSVFEFTVFSSDYWNSGSIIRATNVGILEGCFLK
jgi:lipopolysaccharide transport system ATP-binding protein